MNLMPTNAGNTLQPLAYARTRERRPGILIAVGIMSILVGSLSVLISLKFALRYQTLSRFSSAALIASAKAATLQPKQAGSAAIPMVFTVHRAPGAMALGMVEASLSICAAGLLIVAGIAMLRDAASARRLHNIYIGVKFPLIFLAAAADWWLYTGTVTVTSAGPPGAARVLLTAASIHSAQMVRVVVIAGFSMIYPIALLIVFSTPRVKEHFTRVNAH